MVITFAGALQQASAYCMYLKAELFSCTDCTLSATAGLLSRSSQSRHGLVLFPPARQFFSSLIDGCLKYKNKEKPKTGPRPEFPSFLLKINAFPMRYEIWNGGKKVRQKAGSNPGLSHQKGCDTRFIIYATGADDWQPYFVLFSVD